MQWQIPQGIKGHEGGDGVGGGGGGVVVEGHEGDHPLQFSGQSKKCFTTSELLGQEYSLFHTENASTA